LVIEAAVSLSTDPDAAARLHGEVGWRAHAFPVSVDGIEIVASLVLLAHRRSGARAGWLLWAALVTGTAASVAANVAVGASDPVGRLVAGWPAVALLVSIKLFSGLLDPAPAHAGSGADTSPATVPSGPGSASEDPVPHRGPESRPTSPGPAGAIGSPGDGPVPVGTARTGPLRHQWGTGTVPAELEDAARVVRDQLIPSGTPANRRSLGRPTRCWSPGPQRPARPSPARRHEQHRSRTNDVS
jgi:hypothetical protein